MRHLVVAIAILVMGCTPARTAAQAPAPSPVVGMDQRMIQDSSRRSWAGTGDRPVAVTLWYPADASADQRPVTIGPPDAPLFLAGSAARAVPPLPGKRPLILLSHGTGGSALQLMWLGERLVRAGYLVAAVDHHGNTGAEDAYLPQGFILWWERARDISFALDRLLADPQWASRIDEKRIGAAGFSLGGYTTLLLAGARVDLDHYRRFCASPDRDATCESPPEMPDLHARFEALAQSDPALRASLGSAGLSFRDPRIRAAFLLAPVGANALSAESLRRIEVPVAIVVGEADRLAAPATNARAMAAAIADARLRIVPDAGHYVFLARCGEAALQRLGLLCRDAAPVDRAAVHRDAADEAVAFFTRAFRQSR